MLVVHGHTFAVQEHSETFLHYDVRYECANVYFDFLDVLLQNANILPDSAYQFCFVVVTRCLFLRPFHEERGTCSLVSLI